MSLELEKESPPLLELAAAQITFLGIFFHRISILFSLPFHPKTYGHGCATKEVLEMRMN